MKALVLRVVSLVSLVVASCAAIPAPYHATVSSVAVEPERSPVAYSPDAALAELNKWYSNTTANCGSATRPAFLCSGVLMRQVETSDAYLSWDPSSNAIAKGGISFSWIRADSNFPTFWKPNGFIFYPDFEIPSGKFHPAILCAFPFDGNSWERTENGCGQHRADSRSRPCDVLGITTATAWIDNYYMPGAGGNIHAHQCGWNVREGQPTTADRFQQNILARANLKVSEWNYWNELVLGTWRAGTGGTLPIHSFFYKNGDAQALTKARSDQTRYFNLYGLGLPIFRVTLPTESTGRAQFSYVAADQAVTPTRQ
ncbi:hypothetical protein IM816_03610 [Luteibacter flocculans]|uniref:Halovibrin HvnA n=1 Tax=Luteibacter flocculans TaxID=2780091 RepID=A0ABY4T8K1_9GAMM|nr:hypothetical protein [Luteibacter flocculans]URL59214.1 hypothetical protein IM816_03610 [Luteibacter flocculans]